MCGLKIYYFLLSVALAYLCSAAENPISNEEFENQTKAAIKEAVNKLGEDVKTNKQLYDEGFDSTNTQTSSGQLDLFASEDKESYDINNFAFIATEAAKLLQKWSNISFSTIKHSHDYLKIWREHIHTYCYKQDNITCDPAAKYRTADGSCNNLLHKHWGQSFQPQARHLVPRYDDIYDSPRQKSVVPGKQLPSPRYISNILFRAKSSDESNRTHAYHSGLVMTWGQYIDHDVGKTPTAKGVNGSSINCCDTKEKHRIECFPINVPDDDPYFKTKNITCLNVVRSTAAPKTHSCEPAPREQPNQVSSYIDASTVYGSTQEQTNALRLFEDGKLKTRGNELPPSNKPTACVLDNHPHDKCFLGGDARINVVPTLSAIHILFIREHNRLAAELKKQNPHWTDETLFQESRRIVAAFHQLVTYREFLPTLLNGDLMSRHRLHTYPYPGAYNHNYFTTKNAGIRNSFLAASFRYGHSLITNSQLLQYANLTTVDLPLTTVYHKPHLVQVNNASELPCIARSLTSGYGAKSDRIFETSVVDKLFPDKEGRSFDLPAINVQRGRDHGLPSYNAFRKFCNLKPATHFETHTGGLVDHTAHVAKLLGEAYEDVDDIDLYAGGMSETQLPGADVGPTFGCLIAKQFHVLKFGDRFWFENVSPITGFTRDQLAQVKKMTLSKLLCTNFDLKEIKEDAFNANSEIADCAKIGIMKMSAWKEKNP